MATINRLAMLHLNDVVLRVPKRRVDWDSKDGRDLSEAICTEIAILSNEHLRRHKNITELIGICWGVDSDRVVMPVLVLETAQGGDLCKYLEGSTELDARDRLRLAIHCFQGLLALHTVGIIHADLKPENILVFIDEKGRPFAKLTDFGCSILVSNIHEPIKLKSGTALWQSPRVLEALDAQGLRQADIYSLTLAVSLLLVGPFMNKLLEQVHGSGDCKEPLPKLKTDDGALASFIRMQKDANDLSGPRVFTDIVSGHISEFFDSRLFSTEGELEAGAAEPLELLRTMLHHGVISAATDNVEVFETFDSLEEDVYLSHYQTAALDAQVREEADISTTSDGAFSESNQLQNSNKLRDRLSLICRYLVNQSWNLSLQKVLILPGLNPDLCVSLLMQACQKGDYQIAKVLIEQDTPLRDETSGLTPLHFLAHFGDEDILPLARLLIDRGLDIETRCSLVTPRTVGQLDLGDTLADATPLLLSVAQSSLAAVSALVSLGADPFNGAEKYEPHTGTMTARKRGRTYSPVHYAARLHMSDVLEALLPKGKAYEHLLDWMCHETHSLKVTPLWCAVDYWYQGLYNRVALHGKYQIKRCEETITLLLQRGGQGYVVNWDVTTQVKHSIFTAATLYGQPFVLNHLRSLNIHPTTNNLIRTLQTALDVEDLTAVECLLPLAERETRDSESAFQPQASIQGHKLPDFIGHLYDIKERVESNARSKLKLELIRDPPLQETIGPDVGQDILQQKASQGGFKMSFTIRPGPGGRSMMEPGGEPTIMPPKSTPLPVEEEDSGISAFEMAVMGGYEALARELYESEHCDVSCRRVDEGGDETTLLARLIRKSRKYSNFDRRILFLLALTPPSEEEFFRACIPSGSTANERLSILHMSIMLDECPTNFKPRAPRQIISDIIEKYPEPEYLNAVNAEFGAAVHIAVECGNLEALKELQDEDVEWNLLNAAVIYKDSNSRMSMKKH
ncbi:CAMK DCAMKL kinase [Fusarium circinatum]|uniref:non-specific serine/threonine protein kinase n=1 Tax=Fusarium circinatum TaxID=48490 RepID=A0A8H5TKV5_FUSCI|nr:CAMK DCAMKL kinase [Fusarium circinatum]